MSAEELLQRVKSSQMNQCGICGRQNQKVCWECHQLDIQTLENQNKLLHAKVETISVRFNELLQRLQVMVNMKLDHLKVPEEKR